MGCGASVPVLGQGQINEMATVGRNSETMKPFRQVAISRRWLPREYKLGALLGQGGFGKVWKATRGNEHYAIKSALSPNDPRARQEVEILFHLRDCEFIPRFHASYVTFFRLYLIQEFCSGGDLFTLLEKDDFVAEEKVASIMTCVFKALDYAHSKQIAHRDVKVCNIVIVGDSNSPRPRAKLCDWGCATHFTQPQDVFEENVGSAQYTAPEILKKAYIPSATDMWASGIVIYYLLSGELPFDAPYTDLVYHRILSQPFEMPIAIQKRTSHAGKHMLQQLTTRDSTKRITAAAALRHPWIVNCGGEAPDVKSVLVLRDAEPAEITDKVCGVYAANLQQQKSRMELMPMPLPRMGTRETLV